MKLFACKLNSPLVKVNIPVEPKLRLACKLTPAKLFIIKFLGNCDEKFYYI
jgi:propanediol dehydratase large subunit